jgi:hypothetical protein
MKAAADTKRGPAAHFNEIRDLRACACTGVSANADTRRGDIAATRAEQRCALSVNPDRQLCRA